MAPRKSASKAAPNDDGTGTYPAWSRSVSEVATKWGVNLATGLSQSAVEARRAVYGFNELKKEASKPLWKLILEQFDDPLVKARPRCACPHCVPLCAGTLPACAAVPPPGAGACAQSTPCERAHSPGLLLTRPACPAVPDPPGVRGCVPGDQLSGGPRGGQRADQVGGAGRHRPHPHPERDGGGGHGPCPQGWLRQQVHRGHFPPGTSDSLRHLSPAQENNAESALEALKELQSETAKTLRDGKLVRRLWCSGNQQKTLFLTTPNTCPLPGV